jgi:anti-anti-sigma factor
MWLNLCGLTEGEGMSGLRKEPVSGIRRESGAVIVALAGELDLYNANDVREALVGITAEQPARLVVDLAEVTFIDSTALGVLIETRSRMTNRRAFLLAAPGMETKRALEISGLDKHFSIHDTVDQAIAEEL